jgi:hypothetical protein
LAPIVIIPLATVLGGQAAPTMRKCTSTGNDMD